MSSDVSDIDVDEGGAGFYPAALVTDRDFGRCSSVLPDPMPHLMRAWWLSLEDTKGIKRSVPVLTLVRQLLPGWSPIPESAEWNPSTGHPLSMR